MKIPTLYLDTSVIGGYYDAEWMQDTRELWRGRLIRIRVGEPLAPPHEKLDDDAFLAQLSGQIDALRPAPGPVPALRSWTWLSKLF